MRKPLLFCCLILAACHCIAQNFSCGLDTMRDVLKATDMQQQLRENLFRFNVNEFRQNNSISLPSTPFPPSGNGNSLVANAGCFSANFIIPVIVHVVHSPYDTVIGIGSNISVNMINDQITLLNQQFANYNNTTTGSVNTGIQFCLAPVGPNSDGIFRYGSTLTNTNTSVYEFNQLSGLVNSALYPFDEYLHVYVVSSLNKGGGKNFAGFAAHPTLTGPYQYGVAVRYQYFGEYAAYPSVCSSISEGKTLAHEVGHFLGLYHTFEGGCIGLTSSTCDKEGDLCCETPPVNGQQFGCAAANTCTGDIPDKPDMTSNHMAYNSDACRNMFTRDQTEIMYHTLQDIRYKLVDVTHINAIGLPCCVNSAMFSGDLTFHCNKGATLFTAINYNSSTKYKWIISNGTSTFDVTYTGVNTFLFNFQNTGNYSITLMVIEGTDTFVNVRSDYINVIDCGSPIKNEQGTWYFGNRGGLTFYDNAVAPNYKALAGGTIDGPSIRSVETAVTQCDGNGRLLFYAGGRGDKDSLYVWDRNHNKFPSVKSNPLFGSYDCLNGLVVIPHSTQGNKFLLVSMTGGLDSNLMYYRVIDTTLNGNLGEISGRLNRPVKVPNGSILNADTAVMVREPLAAARGCDDSYYWLIAIDGGKRNNNSRDSSFLVFMVRRDSVIFSNSYKIKRFISYGNNIEISPDGTKLVFGPVVYDFDKKTGVISEFIDFSEDTDPVFYAYYPDTSNQYARQQMSKSRNVIYSLSFSPDSRILYFQRRPYEGLAGSVFDTIFQMDLYKAEPSRFMRTVTTLPVGILATFQAGPDNRIYINRNGHAKFAVINSPDSLITDLEPNNCGYSYNGTAIGGNSYFSLPNFMDTRKDTSVKKEIFLTIRNCREYTFHTNICCANSYLWQFGDNTSATGNTANHTFASEDSFTVKLIAGSDTVIRTIRVGGISTQIIGRTIGCDTSQPSEYYSIPRNSENDYQWSTIGGNLLAPNPIMYMPISWNTSGKVMVSVTNKVTGCIARDTFDVSKQQDIADNVISGDTAFCPANSVLIGGSTPSGGNGIYSFAWYRSVDGVIWEYVPDSIRKHLLNLKPDSLFYYREVNSNGCISNSNISSLAKPYIASNTITLDKDVCLKGGTSRLSGYGLNTNGNDFYYYWQYSSDSSIWNTDTAYNGFSGTDTAKINRYVVKVNSRLYIRRKIVVMGCEHYSNVVSILSPVTIRKQPLPFYVCHFSIGGSQLVRFRIRLNKFKNSPLTFQWQCQNTSGSWSTMGVSGTAPADSSITSSNSFFISYPVNGSTYVRCLITGCGDTLISSSVSLTFTNNVIPTFSQTPADALAPTGQKARFVAKSNSGNIRWQYSRNNGNTWADLAGEDDTVMLVGVEDFCNYAWMYPSGYGYNKTQYRAVVSNGCKSVASGHVFAYSAKKQVVVRDWVLDFGKEPSDTSIKKGRLIPNPMISPDIAISYSSLYNPFTNNDTGQFVSGDSGIVNYVWVRVRNRGTETSLPTTMDIHWSLASSGLQWSRNWTDIPSNRFWNPYKGAWFPKGGKINNLPISVPALAPGAIHYVSYMWDTTTSPKAENYYKTVKFKFGPIYINTVNKFPKNQSICLLARMPECSLYGSGMTFPETGNSSENCRLNNKIAAKVRNLSYLKPPPYTAVVANDPPVIVRNPLDSIPADITVGIRAGDSLVTNVLDVVATLDSVLEQQWTAGGMLGYGFTVLEPNRVLVTDVVNFKLENITLDTAQEGAIYFDFYQKLVPTGPGTTDYTFDVWQTSDLDSMPEGFVQIILNAPNYITGGGGGEGMVLPKEDRTGKATPEVKKSGTDGNPIARDILKQPENGLNAYPNPTGGSVRLEWNCECNGPFRVEIVNMLGEVVYITTVGNTSSVAYSCLVPLEGQPDGIYTARIVSDRYNESVKVTLIR